VENLKNTMKKLILAASLCGLMLPLVAKDAKTTKTKSCCSMLSRSAMLKNSGKIVASTTAKKTDKTAVYAVSQMECDGCAKGLAAGLSKEKGVSAVKVDFKTKRATLRFDPKQTDSKKLEAAFSRKGFPAKLVRS
jgi:mercuric ion binding protein